MDREKPKYGEAGGKSGGCWVEEPPRSFPEANRGVGQATWWLSSLCIPQRAQTIAGGKAVSNCYQCVDIPRSALCHQHLASAALELPQFRLQ